ncbi:hypothetical protein [Micromonospora sp. ATA51]|uniref:hypothetical protein n=1 Tax=Micromonospora sp. ATA51 TaxID=2806098 RepID=UPI001EE3ED03|nr:hypothetical protein [Micromonospora sp. ATA51]
MGRAEVNCQAVSVRVAHRHSSEERWVVTSSRYRAASGVVGTGAQPPERSAICCPSRLSRRSTVSCSSPNPAEL